MAEAPKYDLHQTSYIDNAVFVSGPEGPVTPDGDRKPVIYVDAESKHIPGPHWEPLNDAAREMCKKHGIAFTGFVPDSVDKFANELVTALKERAEREANNGNPTQIAAAMVLALQEAGVIPKPKKAKEPVAEPAEI